MTNMNLFDTDIKYVKTKLLGKVILVDKISVSESDGQLEKWIVQKDEQLFYLKGCSSSVIGEDLYECESECIASELAHMLGISAVVDYHMDELIIGEESYKVCLSADFVEDKSFVTYAELIPNIAKLHGKEKYDAVINHNKSLQEDIDKILLFDAIIGNDDRHLNNLAIVSSDTEDYLPLFDNGASMFSKLPDDALKFANRTSFEYQKCKPFFHTVNKQLELVKKCDLTGITREDMINVVKTFLSGKRAEAIITLLTNNLEKVGERYGKKLLY